MDQPSHKGSVLSFGNFTLDTRTGELRRNGTKLRLQGQPFQVLVVLLERAGEVVTREELQQRLWAADTFVDFDNGLNIAIKKLRATLGDDAETPRYIETLPRRGYRFLARVTVELAEPVRPSAAKRAPLVLMPKQEEPAISAPVAGSTNPFQVDPDAVELGTAGGSDGQVAARETVVATLPSSDRTWKWIAIAAVMGAIAGGLLLWWSRPPAVPVVEAVEQLTDDGEPKQGRLVSDGSRVYFNEGPSGSWKIAQVSVTGGRTASVDTRLVNPQIAGLAPDSSALLGLLGDNSDSSYPLWWLPLPAGEPRRLGSVEVLDAGVLPDGRVTFSTGPDLFVAEKDGSNAHKLVSVADTIWDPSASPDGKRIVFRMARGKTNSLLEITTDGTNLRTILHVSQDESLGAGAWNSDGRYFVYSVEHGRSSDLWALPMQTGIFHRSTEPIRLTNGPLHYLGARTSRDGKQLFTIGTKRRGELIRYDMQSHQFVPFLSGISAISPSFSKDGQWVAYVSYPDHTLWRSRGDGSERRQLTYPPMEVAWPSISPDGTKVAFTTCCYETHVIDMDGGLPQRIDEHSSAAHFSPDQDLLIMTSLVEGKHNGDKNPLQLEILDVRTGKISVVPFSEGKLGGQWITEDTIVAASGDTTKFLIFDRTTEKWTELAAGNFVNWAVSPDGKYLTFTTGGPDPKVQRLRFADRQIETIASLKDLRRVVDSVEISGTQVTVAPDGSPVFTRDIGTQEIYSLTVKWP